MAQIIVRNLDEKVVKALKERAQRNNRSLEAEVRHILEGASEETSWEEAWSAIDAFRERMQNTKRTFSDSGELLGRVRSED